MKYCLSLGIPLVALAVLIECILENRKAKQEMEKAFEKLNAKLDLLDTKKTLLHLETMEKHCLKHF